VPAEKFKTKENTNVRTGVNCNNAVLMTYVKAKKKKD
jgi:hypothetical protein